MSLLTNMDKEKIIDKIKAMLNLRDNHAATQGEIENASTLIQKLLFKYNLTMSEVESTDSDRNYDRQYDIPEQRKREARWIPFLYNTIARFNFCTVVVEPKRDNPRDYKHLSYRIAIIGRSQNVEVVSYLCSWLIPKIRLMCDEAFKNYAGPEKRGQFTRGYLHGCASGIYVKLLEESKVLENESDQTRALVRVRNTELEAVTRKFYPGTTKVRSSALGSYDGKQQGYEDGKKIQLTKGIETRSRKLIGG